MAYELYLRAVDRLSRLNRWDTRTAIDLLEQATKLDPRFAEAWARLGEAYTLLGTTQEPDPKWFRRADAAIRRALAINPNNAEAHCSRGRVLWSPARGFRNREALKSLNKALQINPGCHPALVWRSMVFMHLGLHQEARQGLLAALATQPDDAFTLNFLGQTAMYTKAYEEADEYHARAIRADRANLWANIFYPQVDIYRGRLEPAEEKIETARGILGNDPWLESCEAHIWALRGELRRARHAIARALRGRKPLLHTHHMWHTAGVVYALLGQPEKAVLWLNKAGKTGLPNHPLFLNDPHLKVLRGKPVFERFLAAMKKEWEAHSEEFGQK
jgi:tetratricopeptide (TPR) repeat protein